MKVKLVGADGKSLESKLRLLKKHIEEKAAYWRDEAEYLVWADQVVKGALANLARVAMVEVVD